MSDGIKIGDEGSAVSRQVTGPVEACPSTEHHGEHEWLVNGALRRYCPGDPVPSETVERPPWRFDVPEVPDSVTCLQEVRTGRLWVLRSGAWLRWNGGITSGALLLGELLAYAPLVECPDPRAAS